MTRTVNIPFEKTIGTIAFMLNWNRVFKGTIESVKDELTGELWLEIVDSEEGAKYCKAIGIEASNNPVKCYTGTLGKSIVFYGAKQEEDV